MAVAVLSVLALAVTGFAWRSIDSLRNNLATAGGLGLGGSADGAVDILMVGTDSRTDAHGNPLSQEELDSLRAGEEVASNTDTIVLIRVPNDGSSATAISIPRDSYVNVPGIGMSKINAAYGATKETERLKLVEDGATDKEAEAESTKAGREALVKSVADLTGITVDHYAEVGLLGFVLLTNAVGGVDVCLNQPVDEDLSGAHFPAGKQTLKGADALSFVRQRHDLPRGDLDRIVRQQVFMASLVGKVLSAKTLSDPGKLNELSDAVQRSVVLDDDWDIIEFATQLQDLAGGKVQFETIPVADLNGMTDYGESIVEVKPKDVKKYVAGLVGEEPTESEDTTTSKTPDIDKSTVTVDVANASDVGGLANGVAEALNSLGYSQGEVGNYTGKSVNGTTVFAHSADDDSAKAVAAALGGLPTDTDASLPEGSVRVVLASDYQGPTSAETTSTTSSSSGSSETGLEPVSTGGTTPTPAPSGPPIDAGSSGPRCVN
ncbi:MULTISPECIES: LCP family protein [unclassified Rhodococcus (in: high G+C Gram-positive bacteria)]|uniref:LCP family protein n=1 Tax=unclassified Rhodococcus (in: high G+C Gram-positive bacteria) TaxID=192944 RepID=UPI001639A663|nr:MULTISPECIES: LCP family protein [unclassified Rhodococcus (in: high G+C Gram-positive bacteria)]MBC2643513.1 LCP family protein [Rhodococcus sp. 3A]MBC2891747.1 LCP family protein [Rhodococcus sp. 4CII]